MTRFLNTTHLPVPFAALAAVWIPARISDTGAAREILRLPALTLSPLILRWGLALMAAIILVLAQRLWAAEAKEREYAEFVRRSGEREALHEKRYRELLDNSSDIVYTHDLEGKLISWNKAGELITGYTQREVLQKSLADLAPPENRSAVRQWLQQIPAGRSPKTYELVIAAKDGRQVTLDVSLRTITQAGRQAGILGFARDITARIRAEEALKESELRLRTVVANVPVILFALDRSGSLKLCEGKGLDVLGIKPHTAVGHSVRDLEGCLPGISLQFARAISGETFTATQQVGDFIYEGHAAPIFNDKGEVTGLIGIAIDVTERKRSEQEARKARDVAEAASRAKSEFLANMSHEIRTPMNGVLGMTELALETDLTAEQREYLETVKLSADSLLRIINDILDFSKIEAGKLELDSEPFSLHQVLDATLKPLTVRARQKGLALISEPEPGLPDVLLGDAGRLSQVLTNLVGNAIKFTELGSIGVKVSAEADRGPKAVLRFEVTDTGIGIPAGKERMIFEAFAQADGSTTRKYGGTGLGLTITRKIVEMMGGAISVHSEAGKGSTFRFMLPFLTAHKEVPTEGHRVAEEEPFGEHTAQPPSEHRDILTPRILLAEDNPANQKLIVHLLRKQGYDVEVAADGREVLAALEKAAPAGFDLVLMDVQMPRMNGFEATAAIREREKHSGHHLPIIALTAHAMKGDMERCLREGMDGYVSKPVQRAQLFEAIDRFAPLPSVTSSGPHAGFSSSSSTMGPE